MNPEYAVLASILLCVSGALLTFLLARWRTLAGIVALLITVASAGLVLVAIGRVLFVGPAQPASFCAVSRFGFALCIYIDGLSAVFLLLAIVIAIPTALYSIRYIQQYPDYTVARYYPYVLIFLAAMYGLLSTSDMMWFFLIFWQMMTLSGYALIRFEHRKRENVRAAWKYLFMMQIACATTLMGAALVATDSKTVPGHMLRYDFATVSANIPLLLAEHPVLTAFAFGLFLVGFGIKMGMWPFGQVWLPDAHPAAPSPVSSMLSGVMIKTGVYGLMRYFLWLVPAEAQEHYPIKVWGAVVALLGTVTLFTGTMQALKQEQSKRLLAFHSIGQVGYILLGTGTAMLLIHTSAAAFAAIAFVGALFHVVNHGVFKGLLFLNAGSMLHAVGTQDLNRMGGLMKYMPLTGVTALIASASISGVPLFNGFVSKWLLYTAAVQGSVAVRYLAVLALIAILTSALTLASFIKFFGASFLSRQSSLVAARAQQDRLEVPWSMQLPQVTLAGICVLLGVVPAIAVKMIGNALIHSRGGLGKALADALPVTTGALTGVSEMRTAVFSPLIVALLIAGAAVFAYLLGRVGGSTRRRAQPWLCGYAREADCNRYIAHNFYGEIKRYFRWLGGAHIPAKNQDVR